MVSSGGGRGRGKRNIDFFPQQIWKKLPKSANSRSWSWPDHFYKVSAQSALIWPISLNISLFFQLSDPPRSQFFEHFSTESSFFEKNSPWDPYKMKDLKILHPNHCSTAPETLMRPTWWQKTVKNLKHELFQTVFPHFSYQDDFLATWDPSQMKDLEIPHLFH